MDIHLNDYEVLAITGPQGCGKSTLARKMAEALGTFTVVDNSFLNNYFQRGDILAQEFNTIVIEEFVPTPESFILLKNLVSNNVLMAQRMGTEAIQVTAPINIILCTGSKDALKLPSDARRFFVLEMPEAE